MFQDLGGDIQNFPKLQECPLRIIYRLSHINEFT